MRPARPDAARAAHAAASPTSPSCESETVARHELMDGPPVRGESVPIRLPLSSYDLTPTYRNVHNKVRGGGWGWGCVGLG